MKRRLDPAVSRPSKNSFCLLPVLLLSLSWLATASFAGPTPPVQERVREGQLVRLKLHNILTTENVQKGDTIDFDVAEDVVMNGHVIFAKGAVAKGTVVKVKGAGKKKAKDASVTFRFDTVRAVDNQEISLRARASRSKKKDEKEDEIEEFSPIPGLAERMVGADKGKEYAAYTDKGAVVNALDSAASPASAAATASPASPAATGSATSATPAPAASLAAMLPVGDAETEQVNVDFRSDPPGADIFIDGTFRGNTPTEVRVSPGRTHQIEVRFGSYRPWTKTMWIEPGSPSPSIRATLERP